MLFECATITSISTDRLTLESIRGSACERCARGEGCGGGIIGKLAFRRHPELELDVPHAQQFEVGQRVELSVPARRVMVLAAVVYLIPLIGLLVGALAGQWLLGTDIGSIGVAGLGFVATLWAIRSRIKSTLGHWLKPSIDAPDDTGGGHSHER